MDFSRIKNLIKQNGDKFIMVENGEPEMVVMSFGEYEDMVLNSRKTKGDNDTQYIPYGRDDQTKKEAEDFSPRSQDFLLGEDEYGKKRVSDEEGEDDEFFSAFAAEDAEEEEDRGDFLPKPGFTESDARVFLSPKEETGDRVLLRDMETSGDSTLSLSEAQDAREGERLPRLEDIQLGDLPV